MHAREFLGTDGAASAKILIFEIYTSPFSGTGAEETLESYELWSVSAQEDSEDSTEPVASIDKETVKDNEWPRKSH